MTRVALSDFIQGGFYHIYNRGNHKENIFNGTKDYNRYLDRLREYKDKHNMSVIAYCLMPNHVHLLLRQDGPEPVSTFIQKLHTAYSMYFNKKYAQAGHVFEGRFKAKLVGRDEYLTQLSRYIHLNPKGLVKELSAYKWSSYPAYLQEKVEDFLDTNFVLKMFKGKKETRENAINNYKEFVKGYEGHFEEIHKMIFDYPNY